MPTGPAHMRKVAIAVDADYNEQALTVPCRCTIGYDHDDAEMRYCQILWMRGPQAACLVASWWGSGSTSLPFLKVAPARTFATR